VGQAQAAGALALDLAGPDDQQLAFGAAPKAAGRGRLAMAVMDRGLVDLQEAGQRLALGIDHGSPELGAQQPGRLVGAEAELPLEWVAIR
jgi:hypothetical protein